MKRISLFISMLLMIKGSALADNTLTMSGLSLLPTEEKEMTIELINDDDITAFQFDLTLPVGVTLVTDEKDQPVTTVGSRLDVTHSVEAKTMASKAWRFIGFSSKKAIINGKLGALLSLKVKAGADVTADELVATLSGIVLTKKDKSQQKIASVANTIVIEKPALIVADDKTREYGEENPELTYTMTGRVLSGTPRFVTAATKTSKVGSYDITFDKTSVVGNYYEAKGASLSVTKAPLTIGVKDIVVKQGDKMPDYVLTYKGFKNGETSAVLKAKPEVTSTGTSASEPGVYKLILDGGEADNYDITLVNGKLTVLAADAPPFIPGDANLDGKVDEADVEEVADYIIGHPSQAFNTETADMTGDGEINAADIVAILNIIKKEP